nr:MAG TPA: hypothetical protein [Caudoviricetes sp.]
MANVLYETERVTAPDIDSPIYLLSIILLNDVSIETE